MKCFEKKIMQRYRELVYMIYTQIWLDYGNVM